MGYFIITFFSQFTHAPKIDAVQHIRACESAQAKKKPAEDYSHAM